MNETIIAGVDIGGSHITVALIDIQKREIIKNTRRRKEVNSGKGAEEILDLWAAIITESFRLADSKPTRLGIAMPGPFDYANGISYIQNQNKYDALYGLNIKQQLAERLDVLAGDIWFMNDAACFLHGEMFTGAGKGFSRVMGLTLGTGLGSALSLNQETVDADLWGTAFKDGIAEDYLSTRWFLKRYRELSGKIVKDVKELVSKIHEEVLIQVVFDEFGTSLGKFLVPYIRQEQLELIIFGGNISLASRHFSRAVKRVWDEEQISVGIRNAELGENAALIGAASSHHLSSNAIKV
ncbi:MAG: ROK family protein [Chitinophagaceae bacterium]|nr:MAG: ROK family protein [Chitinophagaceae bacterium]